MDFLSLKQTIKSQVPFEEWRFDLPDFFEFVILKTNQASLQLILEKHFGPSIDLKKPLAPDLNETADKWGGVRGNQTLYFKMVSEALREAALLWPWCDGCKISVKVVQDKPIFKSVNWTPEKPSA